jgi:RimJ/RimL family protein N-acetyltransferase
VTDPRDFLVTAALRSGTAVTFRHVRADDRDRLMRAFRKLERESLYTRFFRFVAEPTEAQLTRATQPDPTREVALVVTTGTGADEAIIAGGRYLASERAGGKRSAEVAFMVEEDYQGQGIAGRLLRHLADIGGQQRVACFEADVLAGNASMLRVFARSGFPMKQRREGDVVHVELSLDRSER